MEVQFRRTSDNSHTLYVPALDEHYHSVHGAWQESIHVFIKAGFLQVDKPVFQVFEMGFGTGLNTLLSIIEATIQGMDIRYHSLELNPLEKSLVKRLNYNQFVQPGFQSFFETIHSCKWDAPNKINNNFCLTKIEADILTYKLIHKYDLIYWDAFGPEKQPELWQTGLFHRIYEAMNPEGIFVTYSAKGVVRRNLEATGFMVTKITGPPGKREMIRARKVAD